MELDEKVRYKIKVICKQERITVAQLARMAGIKQSTMNSIVQGESRNPRIDTIYRICMAVDMSLKEFFSDSIFSK